MDGGNDDDDDEGEMSTNTRFGLTRINAKETEADILGRSQEKEKRNFSV